MGKAGRILVDERYAFFHDNCRFYLGKPCGHQESVNDSVRVATLCSHLPPYSSPLPFSSTAISHSSRPSSSFVHCFALLLCIHLLVVVLIFFPSLQAALPLPSLFRIPHLLLLLQRFVAMMSVSRLSFNQMFDRFCLRKLKNEVKPYSIFDTVTDYHALFLFHR